MPKQIVRNVFALFILLSSLTSCHIAQKMDAYVAGQFNNKVPKPISEQTPPFLLSHLFLPILMNYRILLRPGKTYSCLFTGNTIIAIPAH